MKTLIVLGGSSDIIKHTLPLILDQFDKIILQHSGSNPNFEGLIIKEIKEIKEIEKKKEFIEDKIQTIKADFSSKQGIDQWIDLVKLQCDVPTAIIHACAPKLKLLRLKEISYDTLLEEFNVQYYSFSATVSSFGPKMQKAKNGKIVIVGSSSTIGVPPAFLSHYVSMKYALLGLCKSLAAEMSTYGIQVNTVSPSLMETKFLTNIPEKFSELAAEKNPTKKNLDCKSVANLISFLLSEKCSGITGANFPITNGETF
ncbi:MAG: SDR family oxidoreductase [Oligoflexia bacterium]|nr:SDR family oxidoreductase [Oligoflexia bacterium]